MLMKQVYIRNFRSIRELSIQLQPLTALIGQNNHGKSNILRALAFFFDPGSKLTEDDFFRYRPEGDNEIIVEVTFWQLTEQDRHTFLSYILPDDTIKIRRRAFIDSEGNIKYEYNGYKSLPTIPWLRPENADQYTNRQALQEIGVDVDRYFPASGRITKAMVLDFQRQYIEEHKDELKFEEVLESTPFMGQRNVAAGLLGDYYLIQAVKDVGDEIKYQSTTAFGRIMNLIIKDMATHNSVFQEIQTRIEKLVQELNKGEVDNRPDQLRRLEERLATELEPWGSSVEIRILPPEIERIFQLGTKILIDDGVQTEVAAKGHGLQRAVIMGLIKAWIGVTREMGATQGVRPRAASDTVVLAIEEPELYLHPQAQRTLFDSLEALVADHGYQVIFSTHSSAFLNLERYKSICIVVKPSPQEGTTVRQCLIELFEGDEGRTRREQFNTAYWFNPDRSELFFARRVVLVEGQTEKVVLPAIAKRLDLFDHSITIVDCGGKFNLVPYIRILNGFGIPYCVVHDLDPITVTENDSHYEHQKRAFDENAKIEAAVDPTLGKIYILSPDIESVAGVSRTQGEKLGKALAAYNKLILSGEPLPEQLVQIVRAIYS